MNAYSTLVPTQPKILNDPLSQVPDFSRGSERKFTYLLEVPKVHENRFTTIELPSIATKHIKSPTLTNYDLAPEQSFQEKVAARKLRDALIVEYDINLSQVMPRTKQVPFKPIKFMSEIRHVIPDEPKPRRKPS